MERNVADDMTLDEKVTEETSDKSVSSSLTNIYMLDCFINTGRSTSFTESKASRRLETNHYYIWQRSSYTLFKLNWRRNYYRQYAKLYRCST